MSAEIEKIIMESPVQPARIILDPKTPLTSARAFLDTNYQHDETSMLRHWRGRYYVWMGTHWISADVGGIRRSLYEFMESADLPKDKGNREPFKPNRHRVNEVLDAIKAIANLDNQTDTPAWLEGEGDASGFLACTNGLMDLATRELHPHSPSLFNLNALEFSYDSDAPDPEQLLAFLKSLWGDDPQCVDVLQEIFGLLLTPDTSLQKVFMLVGPKRSGKGTIARVLTALLGRDSVCNPTLASLSRNFGLQPLIGKPLAVIGDARLGAGKDQHTIAERLLSISGEDGVTVDMKYAEPWTGRLTTRFLIMSNELPSIQDVSGALASRFVILRLTESFYGREDLALEKRLLEELPGILNWSLKGLDRLRARGHFKPPESSEEAMREMEALSSPITAFIQDRCEVAAGLSIPVDELFQAWRVWCESVGRSHPGTKQTFGRNLKTAVPHVHTTQPRAGDARQRRYEGIRLQ